MTGLVFKNEHIKVMSQNWDLSRERRVVESGNYWVGGKVPGLASGFMLDFSFFGGCFRNKRGKSGPKKPAHTISSSAVNCRDKEHTH